MNKLNDINYINSVCKRYDFPEGTAEALCAGYERIYGNDTLRAVFEKWLSRYLEAPLISADECKTMLEETAVSEEIGVSRFTAHFIMMILMSPHLKELYDQRGIDEDVFYESLCDLKWKLCECIRMHGIFGSFVASWQLKFFRLEIFALGRLQYEPCSFGRSATVCGVELTEDSLVLSVHIPASGRLCREDCLKSYARAEKFFSYMFEDKTVFMCHSWLLFPEHKIMLPEGSGIRTFAEEYSLVEARYARPGERPWPIFYEKKAAPADELPENTLLERLYAQRYKKGLPSGLGIGVIIYKDGQILNTERDKMV